MGKAKRFNPYDETVKEQRERAKTFGQGRQNLSGIGSTFRAAPLQPPIVTKLRGTGSGDGKFLTVSLSADQTGNLAVNNHVEWNTKDEDGGIVLQTGAGQADGIFELLGGRKYYLQASLRPEFSGTTGQLEVAWFDQTNSAQIGSRAKYEAMDHSGNDANQPTASAIVTPATNILVKVEILSVTALDGLANEYSHANLFEIALGGVVLGGGGGGSSGVTFPITPSINDHGNVGTVTEDIDIGASTGHVHKLTLTGNPTLTFSNPPSSGVQMEFEIEFVQDATGERTVTHPASVAETVSISSKASTTTIVTYRTNDNGTTYHAIPALRGSISLAAAGFATKELDNLGTTAINSSLVSDTDNEDSLGSASKEWKDLFIDGTANIDILSLGGNANFNNNEANNLKGIDFDVGGPTDTTTLPVIWADASGDLIQNVATGDSLFWTINGDTKMNLFEGELDIRSTDQHGVTIRLRNEDTTPQDNDRAGDILFRGDDDGGTEATWVAIESEMNDVSAGAKQGSFKVHCQSDNALAPIIDYSGSDAVFRFSSGVDVVRANADNRVSLGATAQRFTTVYADIYDIQDDQATATPSSSASSIQADTGGMNFGVPDDADVFDFYFNGSSGFQIKEDGELLFNTSGKRHKIIPTGTSLDFATELAADDFKFFTGASRDIETVFITDTSTFFETTKTDTGAYQIALLQNNDTPATARVIGILSYQAENSISVDHIYGQIQTTSENVTNGSENGSMQIAVENNGAGLAICLELEGSSSGRMIGFYGAAPVVQPAHIVDADGTLSDITTKFNQLLADLAGQGLQASS